METLPFNFLGLEKQYCNYRKSKYAILPIPYDATTSYRSGTREGPLAIISASRQVELFDSELGREIHTKGIVTLEPIEPNADSPKGTLDNIFKVARKLVSDKKFILGLGGEHTITQALVKAQKTRYKKFSVLHIDAHLDMRDTWQNSKFSHACVIRRIHEAGIGTVSVGIRNVSEEEYSYIKNKDFTIFTAEQIKTSGSNDWIKQAILSLEKRVYVTIDIDGFDPSVAPGTGTPEPGGLDWYDVTKLLKCLTQTCQIIGADIVEVLPISGQVATEFLAAKLAAKIIALTQISSLFYGNSQKLI